MSEDPSDVEPFDFCAPLSVCVDVRHPACYLALGPVRDLAGELGTAVDWLPFPAAPMKPPVGGDDRGSRHRRIRARYLESDIERYAAVQGLTIRAPHRHPDASLISLALLWLRRRAPEKSLDFLQRTFAGYWAERLDVDDGEAVRELVGALGENASAWADFAAGPGPGELASVRERLVAAGVFAVPSLVAAGEVFVGRAHLPMVRWLLTGRTGAPPV